MADFLKAAAVLLLSQTYIMMGIFFISGQLLPNLLAPVYSFMGTAVLRTVAAAIIVFPLANFGLAFAFGNFNPAMVAPTSIALIVLTNIGFTMAILGAKPSPWMVVAVVCVVASCIWASWLLSQKPV